MQARSESEWAAGYGPIQHSEETRQQVRRLAEQLTNRTGDGVPFYTVLWSLDRLTAAAMWLVVHATYAAEVRTDGRPLKQNQFKEKPEGHTGGSLNMAPAYAAYLGANVLAGETRSWVMGQGHGVAAIDAVNVLAGNMTDAHAARYDISDAGLTQFVQDFYSYELDATGKTVSPLGSHVNAHTAGGMVEGGYLGFTELQYVHMPLPGETLVTFLSDGAWEEQRGSDWAPRWWRAEDSGFVLPIMIHNGRRIDQRSTSQMKGGPAWLKQHLQLHNFDPFLFDGRDPAAFVCAIFEMEERLRARAERVRKGETAYPVQLPYGIAVAPKGAGFAGEGTNLAHNLPLGANPHENETAAGRFNESAGRLHVPPEELREAARHFSFHQISGRVRDKDHPLAKRNVTAKVPQLPSKSVTRHRADPAEWTRSSPMEAIDTGFIEIASANPHLRPRIGNPDEMESNRMTRTLEKYKFRVTDPEPGRPEDVHGAIVSALNEEAIAAGAVGNKGGINLIVTYEAFAEKMHGMLRQEVTFSNGLSIAGRPPGWLSLPLVLTSQTWENSKNEFSHQDPSMCESMLNETSQVSRVVFPVDFNSAAAALEACYRTHGQIWTMVTPKGKRPDLLTREEAHLLMEKGVAVLDWAGYSHDAPRLILTAIGSYQLEQVLLASQRLTESRFAHRVVVLMEPARLRQPRSSREEEFVLRDSAIENIYPPSAAARVFVTHTHPEPILGILSRIHTGIRTAGLGFRNDGGTLDVDGMLWVNGCSWAHCLRTAAQTAGEDEARFLTEAERAALDGNASPKEIIGQRQPTHARS